MRALPRLLLVLTLIAVGGAVAEEPVTADPVLARAYEVLYHPLADAADLIEPLLSEAGVLTLRKRLSTLVVEDRTSVLERVDGLLEDWDVPPQNVEITLSLFLGTDRHGEDPEAPTDDYGLSTEVRGVMEKLSNFMKWTHYEPLGSRSVIGTEGDTVVANLSEDYRVTMLLGAVHKTHGTVKFERLQLQRVTRKEDGSESVDDLYTAGAVIRPGKLALVGAATDPKSNRVLFLALQIRPR